MRKLLSCLAVVLAAPMAAQAQSGCELFNRLATDATNGFAGVIDEQVIGNSYDTSVWLAGADECGVTKVTPPYYYCMWDAGSKVEALADQARMVSGLTPCMTGWSWREMPLDHATANGKGVVSGHLYEGQGANAGVTLALYVKEYGAADGGGSGEFFRAFDLSGRE